MTAQVVCMIDMEQQLAADRDGAYRDQLARQLTDDRQAIKRTIDAGLPPDEFERASRLLAAHDSALQVIATLWSTAHPGR